MQDQIYKTIELTGTSNTTQEAAVENAIIKASATVHNMRWFEVVENRGRIEDGKVAQWQTTIKVGFALDE